MVKHDIIGSIDLGSTQVICTIGRLSETGKIEVLGAGRVECKKGIKNGVVIDIREASAGIKDAIEMAEENAGHTVRKLYVALRGTHIESLNSHGTLGISRTDNEITDEDVEKVIDNAKLNVRLSSDREIVHALPQNFTINGQMGVPNPVGMDGNHLEVDIHVIIGSSVHINNIHKAITKAGFEVIGFVYGILALGENVVTQEEKDLGCILIDIGGLSTGVVTYKNGHIHISKEIEIGSDLISKDLAHYLKSSLATATAIKEKYGVAIKKILKSEESQQSIDYTGIDGRTLRREKRGEIAGVIEPRVDQMVTVISDELIKDGYTSEIFPAGVILSGGGSQLKGIDMAFENGLKTSSRLGNLSDVDGAEEIISNFTYFTAISLLKYHFGELTCSKPRLSIKKSFFSSLARWFDETF